MGSEMRGTVLYACALSLLVASAAAAQSSPSAGMDSYVRARAIVDAGIRALGGEASLRGLRGVRRDLVDNWVDTGQQQHPWRGTPDVDHLPVGERIEVTSYIDYSSDRWSKTQRFDDGPGDVFLQIDASTGETGFNTGRFRDEKPFYQPYNVDDLRAMRAREVRRYPEGLLRLALERPETLQFVGSTQEDGRARDVVSVTDAQGTRIVLYFDAQTHRLARSEVLRDHPVLGDTTADVVYSDYRQSGSLTLPFRYVERIGGIPTHDMRATAVDVAAQPPSEAFEPPPSFVRVVEAPSKPTLNDRGDGVYEILGPYNVMFAVFRDFVLVVEAPIGESYADECLELVRSVAPDKPIRLVATHFHYDHIGGVRAFVAAGIPVLTTADAKEVIERALASRKTLRPDRYSQRPRPADITVAGETTILDDGTQRVEIYDVGPTSHVAEMLVAYFPKQKTLHVADLWDVPTPELAIAGADAVLLMQRVSRLKLDVRRLVPVHGAPASGDDLKRGIAVRAKYLAVPALEPANAK